MMRGEYSLSFSNIRYVGHPEILWITTSEWRKVMLTQINTLRLTFWNKFSYNFRTVENLDHRAVHSIGTTAFKTESEPPKTCQRIEGQLIVNGGQVSI